MRLFLLSSLLLKEFPVPVLEEFPRETDLDSDDCVADLDLERDADLDQDRMECLLGVGEYL